jgi:Tfp pilus assembly protein PilX
VKNCKEKLIMKRSKQKGVALIFALIFILVLSVTAATLMFLSQSETWSSMNYRLMTQSRYGAEAGLHAAANYMMNNYTLPGGAGDPLTAYKLTVSPVTLAAGGSPIALGLTMNGISANYPVGAVKTGFNTASQSSLMAGSNTVNYSVSAELLSMRSVVQCGNSQPLTAQLWRLTSHGDITGTRNSEVEVSALLESHVNPCYNYAGFATGNGCGSISFTGGGTIDSYNSSSMTLSGGSPVTQTYEGNLGSNGNVNTANGTVINGTFSSPDTGVGPCGGGSGVDALTGGGTVTGCSTAPTNCLPAPGLIKLPQTVTFVPPASDYPGCTGATAAGCDATVLSGLGSAPNNLVTPLGPPAGQPGVYGDVSATGNQTVVLNPAGTNALNCTTAVYYINSISLKGNASLTINPCPGTGTNGGNPPPAIWMPVIVNIVGSGGGTVMDIGGNGIANTTFNSSLIQFQYAGNGIINLHGNGATSSVIYAPNAEIDLKGNGTVYGSVIGASIKTNGGPVTIHYDRALSNNLFTVGNWTLDTFTWSKY